MNFEKPLNPLNPRRVNKKAVDRKPVDKKFEPRVPYIEQPAVFEDDPDHIKADEILRARAIEKVLGEAEAADRGIEDKLEEAREYNRDDVARRHNRRT